MECLVHRVPMRDPGDVTALLRLIDEGLIAAHEIVAILGKTEGNGCVNDFSRGYATMAVSVALAKRLGIGAEEVTSRVAIVMSGGTEGGLSPHLLIFAVRQHNNLPGRGKSLAIGTASTPALSPEQIGRTPQVELTAGAVREAVEHAAITDDADVHWVQIKCPLLTSERIADAVARGATVATGDTYASMALSRAAAALGAAVALGDVDPAMLNDRAIGHDFDLWSTRVSASAGIELMHNEVIVLGNSAAWSSDSVIAHGVMRDAIDLPSVIDVLRRLDFTIAAQLDEVAATRVLAVLAKAEASRSGTIRGARHIMSDDSDIQASRHARALVGGVLAGAIGRTDLFVSGGAEHQGPDGGGPIGVIARRPLLNSGTLARQLLAVDQR
jgi:cyanuric acid amidohydrolase